MESLQLFVVFFPESSEELIQRLLVQIVKHVVNFEVRLLLLTISLSHLREIARLGLVRVAQQKALDLLCKVDVLFAVGDRQAEDPLLEGKTAIRNHQ